MFTPKKQMKLNKTYNDTSNEKKKKKPRDRWPWRMHQKLCRFAARSIPPPARNKNGRKGRAHQATVAINTADPPLKH